MFHPIFFVPTHLLDTLVKPSSCWEKPKKCLAHIRSGLLQKNCALLGSCQTCLSLPGQSQFQLLILLPRLSQWQPYQQLIGWEVTFFPYHAFGLFLCLSDCRCGIGSVLFKPMASLPGWSTMEHVTISLWLLQYLNSDTVDLWPWALASGCVSI